MAQSVLVSGAGMAGCAVARWLGRNSYDVTVVEKAPAIRPGGQAVDFKGRTHRMVLERMGVLADIEARRTPRTDCRLVDVSDRVRAVIPGEFIGGDVEILRGDLAEVLFEHSRHDATYMFGDEITAMTETPAGVDVEFAHAAPQRFDLVVGADGVHSAVRRLAFGPEEDFVTPLGYFYAVAGGEVELDGLPTDLPSGRHLAYGFTEPGRMVILGGQKAPNLFVFAAPAADYDRDDRALQVAFLRRHFAGAAWRVPQMLDAAAAAPDFFLDSLSRTRMTSFTRGRVALVGDAGFVNTLGGFGTGLAMVGAYALAGELGRAGGDHAAAFAAYDERMRKPTKVARSGSAGPFLAPPSRWRIRLRDWTFSNKVAFGSMMWMTERFATDDHVPSYDLR